MNETIHIPEARLESALYLYSNTALSGVMLIAKGDGDGVRFEAVRPVASFSSGETVLWWSLEAIGAGLPLTAVDLQDAARTLDVENLLALCTALAMTQTGATA